jgi:hypothetical protein
VLETEKAPHMWGFRYYEERMSAVH